MHILMHEEGDVRDLHYGLFEHPDDRLFTAQSRSTELLISRLPPPPCSILEVGIGLGTTMALLVALGYHDVEGITPDEHQIAMVRERYAGMPVRRAAFETFDPGRTYDLILFQESSQYIEADLLFARAAALAPRVLVLDEFALEPLDEEGALHSLRDFLDAAAGHGFAVREELDLSAKASPTMEYFMKRIPRYRDRLIADLAISPEQIEALLASGEKYQERFRSGTYGYRLLQFESVSDGASRR